MTNDKPLLLHYLTGSISLCIEFAGVSFGSSTAFGISIFLLVCFFSVLVGRGRACRRLKVVMLCFFWWKCFMGLADAMSLLLAAAVWCATYALVAVLGVFRVFDFFRTSISS
ncbi:hypothetical protein Pfo_018439 [Paulownia fortunei]|nr:hypothetical protein Pfo_018439 [Paulownia fortunei]